MTAMPERVPANQLIMQYPITLPADYDMDVIRARVRTRGQVLDDRAGLICKAYCIREVGVFGSPISQYAPFYLWGDATAAAEFLWHGAGFDGVVRDFGRPQVRTWVPEIRMLGPAPASSVTHAVLHTTAIPADADLVQVAERLAARIGKRGQDTHTHLALGGIDPRTWQTVEFATLADLDQADAAETVYTVLHISQPTPWS
jgi:hypothetical protein